jgi:ferredoxin-thioredoxin reductase catalytic chain
MGGAKANAEVVQRMRKFVEKYCEKSGTTTHPDHEVTEAVIQGLAVHYETLGKPLCPCRFYPDKAEEIKHRTWICACDDMQIYKYCHCLLFVNKEGLPITEYLPEDHEGRKTYGLVTDPTPDKGRALRSQAEAREKERKERPS